MFISHLRAEKPTPAFGEALRQQVEERLHFFETGEPPSKNTDAIRKVLDQLALDDDEGDDEEIANVADEPALPLIEPTPRKDKKKKRKADDEEDDEEDEELAVPRLSAGGILTLSRTMEKLEAFLSSYGT